MKSNFYDLPEKYKYSAAFESKIVSLSDEKATKYLSMASQENLKQYLPKNINFEEKVDCLAIAGQSFLANKLNLNDDGVDTETAIRIAELFPLSYIDANHKRDSIVGVILSASYTDEETNKELTKEEVKGYTKPFSVTIGGIVWKLANKQITQALEDDKSKDTLYFSWELGFSDFKLIEIAKDKFNLSEGNIINSAEKVKEYDKVLRANGGKGQLDNGNKIGRVIIGDCIPLGVGIVEHPAGQLDPLVIDNKEDVKIKEDSKSTKIEKITVSELLQLVQNKNYRDRILDISVLSKLAEIPIQAAAEVIDSAIKSFTNEKNSVSDNTQDNQNKKLMDKITKISDLNDENIKECKASAVVDLFNESLKEADRKWKAEEELRKNAVAEKEKTDATLAKVQEDLKKLQDAALTKELSDLYTQRMSYFDDTYELSKEERQAIAEDISVEKNVDKDSFDKIKSKYDIFLKEKSKAAIQAKVEAEEAEAKKSGKVFDKKTKKWVNKEDVESPSEDKKGDEKESKASLNDDQKIIDDALKNGQQANAQLPNAQGGEQTLEQKYAEAFKPENCIEVRK